MQRAYFLTEFNHAVYVSYRKFLIFMIKSKARQPYLDFAFSERKNMVAEPFGHSLQSSIFSQLYGYLVTIARTTARSR
jgi:hypothetical protein